MEDSIERMSRQYTKSEVASLNGKDKTLIILHDKVYDVTSFMNEHPGGEEILMDHGGIDGSEDFDDVGHSSEAFDLMKKYVVGELVDSEKTHKQPKMAWANSYAKAHQLTDDSGTNPLVVTAIIGIVLAILYFVYL